NSRAHARLARVPAGGSSWARASRARRVLDQARALLLSAELLPVEQTALACAYVTTLGQAPIELALARMLELFRKLEGVHDPYTTSTHYSRSRLDLVEAMILSLGHEGFTIDPKVRRWLDDAGY